MTWLYILGYLLVALACVPWMARAWDDSHSETTMNDVGSAMFFSLFWGVAAVVLPFFGLAYVIKWWCNRYPTDAKKQRRIEELEQENGIGQ